MAAQRRRLTILGLDGLSLPLARRLAELHRLPAVASLATAPSARTVPSELPELSPVNWTALATASGPETHGVYGFTRLDPTDFSLSLTDFSHVQAPTVFDRLGEAGLTSRVVNLPNTYPARPIPGMLVSGFVAPNLHRACHPPMLAAMLEQRGYLLEADTTRGAAEPDHLLAQLRQTIASRRSALDLLWDDLDWDCFCLVLTETDRLFHFLLPAALDPDNHLFAPITAVLRQWDELVGEVLERHHDLPEPKRFITVADHGFTETITEVDLNAVLRDMGLLRLRHEPRDEWDTTAIDPASRAFALDPSRVYIHTSDRFPHGPVPPAEAPAIARAVSDRLAALQHHGQPVIQQVHTRHDLYNDAPRAPDLVATAHPGYELKAKLDRVDIFSLHGRFGCHTPHDAIFTDTGHGEPGRMREVGELVLEWFGIGSGSEDFALAGDQGLRGPGPAAK